MASYAVLHDPVVGFNELTVTDEGLRHASGLPLIESTDLHEREQHADGTNCLGGLKGVAHPPAHPQCCCGAGGWSVPLILGEDCIHNNYEVASALCIFWGDVLIHGKRVTASHGRIVAVASPPAHCHRLIPGRLNRAAEALGIPRVPWHDLQERARKLGPPLPTGRVPQEGACLLAGLDFVRRETLPDFTLRISHYDGIITPWYFAGTDLATRARFTRPEAAVVGEIFCPTPGFASVRLARCPAERREATRIQLKRWGEKDGWQVELEPGLFPLTWYDGEHRKRLQCARCGDAAYLGMVSGMGASWSGYFRTLCHACGGRKRMVPNP